MDENTRNLKLLSWDWFSWCRCVPFTQSYLECTSISSMKISSIWGWRRFLMLRRSQKVTNSMSSRQNVNIINQSSRSLINVSRSEYYCLPRIRSELLRKAKVETVICSSMTFIFLTAWPATGCRDPAIGGNLSPHVKPFCGQQRSRPLKQVAGDWTTMTQLKILKVEQWNFNSLGLTPDEAAVVRRTDVPVEPAAGFPFFDVY